VADGIQVDFDVDYELSGFRAVLGKIIFGGLGRAHAAIHRPPSTEAVSADAGNRGGSRRIPAPAE
jgi:hypothetical protein